MEDYDLNSRTAHYKTFNISDAKEGYKLTIGDYEGDAGKLSINKLNISYYLK